MINYQGIKNSGKVCLLCFSNDRGVRVEVPIDEATGNRISLYLNNFDNKAPIINVERGNDELSEEE